jgi:hypothetical protein
MANELLRQNTADEMFALKVGGLKDLTQAEISFRAAETDDKGRGDA